MSTTIGARGDYWVQEVFAALGEPVPDPCALHDAQPGAYLVSGESTLLLRFADGTHAGWVGYLHFEEDTTSQLSANDIARLFEQNPQVFRVEGCVGDPTVFTAISNNRMPTVRRIGEMRAAVNARAIALTNTQDAPEPSKWVRDVFAAIDPNESVPAPVRLGDATPGVYVVEKPHLRGAGQTTVIALNSADATPPRPTLMDRWIRDIFETLRLEVPAPVPLAYAAPGVYLVHEVMAEDRGLDFGLLLVRNNEVSSYAEGGIRDIVDTGNRDATMRVTRHGPRMLKSDAMAYWVCGPVPDNVNVNLEMDTMTAARAAKLIETHQLSTALARDGIAWPDPPPPATTIAELKAFGVACDVNGQLVIRLDNSKIIYVHDKSCVSQSTRVWILSRPKIEFSTKMADAATNAARNANAVARLVVGDGVDGGEVSLRTLPAPGVVAAFVRRAARSGTLGAYVVLYSDHPWASTIGSSNMGPTSNAVLYAAGVRAKVVSRGNVNSNSYAFEWGFDVDKSLPMLGVRFIQESPRVRWAEPAYGYLDGRVYANAAKARAELDLLLRLAADAWIAAHPPECAPAAADDYDPAREYVDALIAYASRWSIPVPPDTELICAAVDAMDSAERGPASQWIPASQGHIGVDVLVEWAWGGLDGQIVGKNIFEPRHSFAAILLSAADAMRSSTVGPDPVLWFGFGSTCAVSADASGPRSRANQDHHEEGVRLAGTNAYIVRIGETLHRRTWAANIVVGRVVDQHEVAPWRARVAAELRHARLCMQVPACMPVVMMQHRMSLDGNVVRIERVQGMGALDTTSRTS